MLDDFCFKDKNLYNHANQGGNVKNEKIHCNDFFMYINDSAVWYTVMFFEKDEKLKIGNIGFSMEIEKLALKIDRQQEMFIIYAKRENCRMILLKMMESGYELRKTLFNYLCWKTDTNICYNIILFSYANIERNYWSQSRYQMI